MKRMVLGLLAALSVLSCDGAADPVIPSSAQAAAAAAPAAPDVGDRRGPPGFSQWQLLTASVGPNRGGVTTASVMCPAGTRPLGGGHRAEVGSLPPTTFTLESRPLWDGVKGGWIATVDNHNSGWTLTVYVICAAV